MNGITRIQIRRERGAILVVALVFLVAITLLTLSSMRSSNINLRMAQNEESRVAAVQAAQALTDAIIANPQSTPVVGSSGYTACTAAEANCNRNDLNVPDYSLQNDVAMNYLSARVERTGATYRPPPRVVESSIDKFTTASFNVTTTFDRARDGLGRQQITEGVIVLVPKQ
ncbi:MAG: PilX N-terminal domain-containing pilus assembly protein [Woeseiaceae bacterium]|nr:PilX N-terminal domain-containing pilus assembly protein [Woeseiaceae bacterium]